MYIYDLTIEIAARLSALAKCAGLSGSVYSAPCLGSTRRAAISRLWSAAAGIADHVFPAACKAAISNPDMTIGEFDACGTFGSASALRSYLFGDHIQGMLCNDFLRVLRDFVMSLRYIKVGVYPQNIYSAGLCSVGADDPENMRFISARAAAKNNFAQTMADRRFLISSSVTSYVVWDNYDDLYYVNSAVFFSGLSQYDPAGYRGLAQFARGPVTLYLIPYRWEIDSGFVRPGFAAASTGNVKIGDFASSDISAAAQLDWFPSIDFENCSGDGWQTKRSNSFAALGLMDVSNELKKI